MNLKETTFNNEKLYTSTGQYTKIGIKTIIELLRVHFLEVTQNWNK